MSYFQGLTARSLCCLAVLILSAKCARADEAVWIGGASGNWSEPTNWSTGIIPDTQSDVLIDSNTDQETDVVLDVDTAVLSLMLDALDTLHVASPQSTIGALQIAGTLDVSETSRVIAQNYVWIQPGGQILMNDTPTTAGAWLQTQIAPVWNQGTIEGGGRATLASFANEGLVEANLPQQTLEVILNTGTSNRNLSEMIATNGGRLSLRGGSSGSGSTSLLNFDGTTAGLIQAKAGSIVAIENMTITGGEISSAADAGGIHGDMQLTNVILNGVRLGGKISANRLGFQNVVENNAVIAPIPGSPAVIFTGPATLVGNGRIELRNNRFQGTTSASGYSFINGPTHTIAGPGTITGVPTTYRLINRGLIEANKFGEATTLTVELGNNSLSGSLSVSNPGVMCATGGAMLSIGATAATVFENFEVDELGLIEADVNSTVRLSSFVTVRGGVLRSVAPAEGSTDIAGKVVSQGTSTSAPGLKDVRLEGIIGESNSSWRIAGSIDNTGELRVGELIVEGTTTLSGGGNVRLSQTIAGGAFPGYLVNEDNRITGSGILGTMASIINRGTIEADNSASSLQFFSIVNSGVMSATGGATLALSSVINREGVTGGTVHADNASFVNIANMTGGTLSTTGTGEIRTAQTNGSWSDFKNDGLLRIRTTTRLSGDVENKGTFFVDPGKILSATGPVVDFGGAGTITSSPGASFTMTIGESSPTFFTQGPQHTYRGQGTIDVNNGLFTNEGTVIAEGGTLTINLLTNGAMIQNGTLRALTNRRLDINTQRDTFSNFGTIDAIGDVYVRRSNTGSMELVNETGANISLRGTLHIVGPNVTGVQTEVWNQAGATLTGKGTIDFTVGTRITGLLRNSGLIRPEGEFAELGRIYFDGDFVQDATGTLEMNVAGTEPGEFDALILEGSDATLGGALSVFPLATFDPPVGQQYTIIDTQGGTVSGVFDTFSAPALSGRWWSLDYQADKVVLSVEPITADFNFDGVVDGLDLAAWQIAYQADNSAADADADGDSDARDFLAWQRQFGSGIAPGGLVAVVPEPNATMLMLVGMIGLSARRWRVKRHHTSNTITIGVRVSSLTAVVALLALLGQTQKAAAVEAVWIGGPSGNWSVPTNWSTGVVPNDISGPTPNVTIDGNPTVGSVVSLDQDTDILNLTIDADDTLNILSGSLLRNDVTTLSGTLNLIGFAQLMGSSSSDNLWIQSTGRLGMQYLQFQTNSSVTGPIRNQGVIEGVGRVNSSKLFSDGTINANISNKPLELVLSNGTHFNAGEFLATNGGFLTVKPINLQPNSTTLQNFSGTTQGLIEARGHNSRLTFDNMTIQGGVISSAVGEDGEEGLMQLFSTILDSVRLEGEIGGTRFTFKNTVENNAVITPFSSGPFIAVGAAGVLTGTGRIELRNQSMQSLQLPGSSSLSLTNEATHTISGPGNINVGGVPFNFVNRGLVEATRYNPLNGETLQINMYNTTVNSGTMRARDKSTLVLTGTSVTTFENFEGVHPGLIEADVDSTVRLSGDFTLRGGTLRAIAPSEPGPALAGKVVSTGSMSSIPRLQDVRLEGTIGDNLSPWRIKGQIENAGEFGGSEILINDQATLSGGGTVRLNQFNRINGVNISPRLVNENNLITGSGWINATSMQFVNRGIVKSSDPVNAMLLSSPFTISNFGVVNSGLLEATNGSTLRLEGSVINREGSVSGTIHADDGSVVDIDFVTGGTLTTSGSGEILGRGLSDVENRGILKMRHGGTFSGNIQNDGSIINEGTQSLFIMGPVTQWKGSGTFESSTTSLNWVVGQFGPTFFVHGPQHTIHGGGTINVANGVFINEGTLIPETSQLTIDLHEGTSMVQQGTFFVQGGQEMEVLTRSSTFKNKGYIEATGEMAFRRANTGSLEVVNEGGASISLRGSLHLEVPDVTGAQTVLWNQEGASLTGKGTIDFSVGGQITGLFRNSGYIRPEGEFAELGRLYLDGDYVQDATGTLEMNVAGIDPGEFDALILDGSDAVLGGALNIIPLATFDPPAGQAYTIIDTQGGTVSGGFDTFAAPALIGRWWSLDYQPDKVVLSVQPITADFNLDGLVDADDLSDWQLAYQAGTNAADADGDGDSDGRDFLAWQRQYGSGVAIGELSVAVPEPGCFLYVGFAAICGLCRRRGQVGPRG